MGKLCIGVGKSYRHGSHLWGHCCGQNAIGKPGNENLVSRREKKREHTDGFKASFTDSNREGKAVPARTTNNKHESTPTQMPANKRNVVSVSYPHQKDLRWHRKDLPSSTQSGRGASLISVVPDDRHAESVQHQVFKSKRPHLGTTPHRIHQCFRNMEIIAQECPHQLSR
eukprot:1112156-Rhodomonas_salina.2